jgi:glucose uptake protein GlcU
MFVDIKFLCYSFELLIEQEVLCVIQISLVQDTLLPATIWCCGQVVQLKSAKIFVVSCSMLTRGSVPGLRR